MTNLLEVRGLSRNFGALQALTSVDLHVEEGEILAIIGPNGCGKTTLFNCVSGRFPPTEGRIWWLGDDITGMSMHRVARQGLVRTFQETRIFPSGTPRSNLEMAYAIAHRHRERHGTVLVSGEPDVLLELCGLGDVADVPATAIPHGYLRRLGVALALITNPRLLLLDEPAAGLNDVEQTDLARLLRRLHESGLTMTIVDHDMDFLLPLAERVVVLSSGEKLCEGTPKAIRIDPAVIEIYLGKSASRVRDLSKIDTEAVESPAHG